MCTLDQANMSEQAPSLDLGWPIRVQGFHCMTNRACKILFRSLGPLRHAQIPSDLCCVVGINFTMRRHRNARLIPLLIAACLFGSALVALPAARAENLSIEEIAEEAALKEEAGDFKDADEPDYHPESEEGSGEDAPIEPIDEKDVVVLTQDTFRDTIKKHQYALVRAPA